MQQKRNVSAIVLFILIGAGLIWNGGYYEYSSVILGVLLSVFLIVFGRKQSERRSCDNYILFSACLVIMYGISCFYAIDRGMAATGAAKKSVLLLFALSLSVLKREQGKDIVEKLPELAAVLTALAAAGCVIPMIRPFIIHAGRFCGTIGYANTYALFLLIALLVLLDTFEKRPLWFNAVLLLVFLTGLWFSGSRFTWGLAFAALFCYAVYQKKTRRYALILLGVLFAATVCAGTIFHHSGAMGRLFTTNLSTLYGRFLYWQDGFSLATKHPFGTGYLGFYYAQNTIQTGVYSIRYVHNDLLQWVLDIGWLPAVLLLAMIVQALCNKRRPFIEKILLSVMTLHGLMEFDFEHTGIAFIFVLLLSCSEEKTAFRLSIPCRSCTAICAVIGCVCLYFSVPLCLYASGQTEAAAVCYPFYTDAQLANLSIEKDVARAEKLADKILQQNDMAFLAYDAKAYAAFCDYRFSDMVQYKKKAIERNKFNAEEYTDYLEMLNEVLSYSLENEDEPLAWQTVQHMQEIPTVIKEKKKTVSKLGKKIDDQVTIDLPQEVEEEIMSLGQ